MKHSFFTVAIMEAEASDDNPRRYATGRAKVMCRSPKQAWRIAKRKVAAQLNKATGGWGWTPIVRGAGMKDRDGKNISEMLAH